MRLRAIVIDDEEDGIETLRLLIEKHLEDVKVVAESTGTHHAIDLIENYKPEIVFLDINMPEMDGFELLQNLRWKNFYLVFTTAHEEYGLRALKNQAMDYLLKPIDHRDLRIAVDRIKAQMLASQNAAGQFDYSSLNSISRYYVDKLGISSKDGVEYLEPSEIVYLESKSNYTLIYLMDGRSILTPKTLREFESSLCVKNLNFMRVHHSFLINLHKVIRYVKEAENIVMVNNQKIPLSKSRKEGFFRWLNP